MDVFRDAPGKRKAKVYYNWETARQETIYCSLLEVRESDLGRNIQYYALTDRGLELVFGPGLCGSRSGGAGVLILRRAAA